MWSSHRYRYVELVVELGGEPVRRRDGDAELAQRLQAQPDRLRETVPVGQAAHLHRRRVRALQGGGAQPLDGAVLLVRLVQAPDAEQGGVPAGVHLHQRGGLARVDQPQRARQERVHQGVLADQRRLVGGAAQQPHHPSALRRIVDRVGHRQVLLGRDGEQLRHLGQPPRHGQLQGLSPRRIQPGQNRLAEAVVAKPHRLP